MSKGAIWLMVVAATMPAGCNVDVADLRGPPPDCKTVAARLEQCKNTVIFGDRRAVTGNYTSIQIVCAAQYGTECRHCIMSHSCEVLRAGACQCTTTGAASP